MYVVKVGEYYVRRVAAWGDIEVSKEVMITFTKAKAFKLAKELNGQAIKMNEEANNE